MEPGLLCDDRVTHMGARTQHHDFSLSASPPSSTQLFPYHLSDYLCRVARLTPFKYYSDMFVAVLKDERSYDRIPNFTVRNACVLFSVSGGRLGASQQDVALGVACSHKGRREPTRRYRRVHIV